jgi:ferredoxin--NADP+ reductase
LLKTGGYILDVVGPLGKPSEIEKFGTVVVIGGGVGAAMAYPSAAAFKRAGNRVISIIGGRNRELVILEQELRAVSDALMITTDDGSYADKGFVTDKLRQLIQNGTRIDLVLAVGPIPMMRAVAEMTRKENIRTVVSLNPIMIDGTGMCGGCRVLIGGKSEFACVDGPEFDAHQVDFEVLVQRNGMYREAEQRSLAGFQCLTAKKIAADEAQVRDNLSEIQETSAIAPGGKR